jgi:hypothetical protein
LGYGNSVYHALQAKLEKRFSSGMTFLMSYAFSKLIDDVGGSFAGEAVGGTGVQNWNNLRGERAVSTFDQPHSLVVSYIWELPFGPGRPLLNQAQGVTKWLVEGWQIQGVSSFQSGAALGISSATNTNFSQGGGQRPNWSGQSANLGDERTIDRWFDATPFTQAPAYAFGNAPRTMGDLRADGATNFDFTVSRVSYQGRSLAAISYGALQPVQHAPVQHSWAIPRHGHVRPG